MEKKRQQVMSTRDPQMSGNFELKGAEGGVQLPYSGKGITSKHAPLVEDLALLLVSGGTVFNFYEYKRKSLWNQPKY